MKTTLFIIGLVSSAYLGSVEKIELLNNPKSKVSVTFVKWPFKNPTIKLRTFDGKLLAERMVGPKIKSNDVEVHVTEQGIVVLPGDSDWVWDSSLWER